MGEEQKSTEEPEKGKEMVINTAEDSMAFWGRQPQALCRRHGVHPRQQIAVNLPTGDRSYPFCPYCYGEWMKNTFPVEEQALSAPT